MSPSELLRNTGRVIGYRPKLAKLFGGATAEIFFEQIFYWQDKADPELGVYKTQAELEEETGLTRFEQETARKKLREKGVLIETHKRLEHKIYYKIDEAALDRLLQETFANEETPHHPMRKNHIRESDKPAFVNTRDYNTRLQTLDITPLNPPEGGADRKRSHSAENLQAETVDLPEYVNRELWVEYCKMRKAKRAPIKTAKTLELCLKDLERLSGGDKATASAVLNQSIKNTWTGLFVLKTDVMLGKPTSVKRPSQTNFADKDYGQTKLPEWAKD